MGKGLFTANVHTADDGLPVFKARVLAKDESGRIICDVYTNENGYIEEFEVEAPDRSLTLDKTYKGRPYAVADVDVMREGFITVHIHDVEIVDGETSILPVMMHTDEEQDPPEEHYYIPEVGVMLETNQRQIGANPFVLKDVIIPDYITVHLGTPTNSGARNVRVKFSDYIKNVASSEIYPTWPTNSLLANIHVITTFALNRVFTEWYRSRGFNFDITNSTAYDQYFVEGRNIFENISNLVDSVFNVYARRYGFANPYFTQYCNGTTSTCQGLSQWGTVDLANRGYTPLQILHYYYPNDLELISSDNIASIVETYPGFPLSQGSSGINVLRIQNFLNRIRANYPLIPLITPDGQFGSQTASAVRTFQRTFNLTADGIVGRSTWNKISQIYVGIIGLGELNGEGIRVGISRTPPKSTIRLNSRGSDVILLQFIINAIASYYDFIPYVIQDNFFGTDTQNAVIEFQRNFGLTADGIVGAGTWSKLYSVYWGIMDNSSIVPNAPPTSDTPPTFSGTLLRLGSQGEDVRLMQTYLNTIRKVYSSIPLLVADGIFGSNTLKAVVAFQNQFILEPDGIIGQQTWDKIVQMFLLVTGNASISTTYPGYNLSIGSTGTSVRTMQTFLRELRSMYPTIPLVEADGIFGPRTREAVVAFQNLFSLTPDGIIGPATWNAIVYVRNLHFGA